MTAPSSPARPRVLRLQFSLRLALMAFTAFAVGFPIWYRWPYEEREVLSAAGAPSKETRVTTWQRQWGGVRLKHGPERLIADGDYTIESTMYVLGRKQGPFFGEDVVNGQYVDDMKEGVWIYADGKRTMTWHRDRLDGAGEIETELFTFRARRADGTPVLDGPIRRKIQLLFAAGRLTHLDGKPASNCLFELMERDKIAAPIDHELLNLTEMSFVETPLRDVAAYFADRHGISIQIDPKVPEPDLPITIDEKGLDLCSALTLLTSPLDLGCDYRYGCIWITTAADAEDWHDPTGVSELKPPNGSGLARIWEEPAESYLIGKPLSGELKALAARMAIEIDTAAIESSEATVTFEAKAPFRHVLGQLLYRTGCRCNLKGDKLVILPPEKAAP